jgi:hypothetical protein
MAEDKKTIGLTDTNKKMVDQIVEKAGFKRDMDAAKFAFVLAVNKGLQPGPVEGAGTIRNVGSFDEGGDLKAQIQNLFPNSDAPYRALESLMNSGFGLLATEIAANPSLRIEELLTKESGCALKGIEFGLRFRGTHRILTAHSHRLI